MPDEQQPIAGAPDQPLRFCRDCRWGEMHPPTFYTPHVSVCLHPKAGRQVVNLVTGEITQRRSACGWQRNAAAAEGCGIAGQWWEPRA